MRTLLYRTIDASLSAAVVALVTVGAALAIQAPIPSFSLTPVALAYGSLPFLTRCINECQTAEYTTYTARGDAFVLLRCYRKAANDYGLALAHASSNEQLVAGLRRLQRSLLFAGDHERALVVSQRIEKLTALNGDDLNVRCAALNAQGNYEQSVEVASNAIARTPDLADLYLNRALANHALGRNDAFKHDVLTAMILGNQPELAGICSGWLAVSEKNWAVARVAGTRLVRHWPSDAHGYWIRSAANFNSGKPAEAVSDASIALAMTGDNRAASLQLAARGRLDGERAGSNNQGQIVPSDLVPNYHWDHPDR